MASVVASAGAKQIISGLLNPSQIPGLQIWLDGADPLGTGTTPANGTIITSWADKSGNGRNATGFGSPPYVSANRNISFNGSSQYFTIPYSGLHPTETGFFVITYANTSTQIVLVGNVSSTRQIVNVAPQVGIIGVSNNASATNPTANTLCIAGYSFNSSISFAYLNGTAGSAGTAMAPGAESFLYLGCSLSIGTFVNGTISEVLIYSQFLSTVQRQAIEGYLAWKWNLISSLPSGHPYLNTAATPASISTSFFPTYMPGIRLWLDGADPLGTGTAPANGTTITTWADKSGNARNATSVGSPVFNTSSNAIVLNGTSQGFSLTYSGVHATETAFAVVNMTTPNSYAFFINSTVSYTRQFYNFNTTLTLGQANIGANASTPSILTASSNTVLGYTLNSTNSFLFFNGVSGPTGTAFSSVQSESTLFIGYSGSGNYLGGTISEILIYDQVLTRSQRQVVEGYLAWKWNIQTSLASNHPFRYAAPNSLSISGLTNFTYSTSYLPGLTAWYDATDPLGTGFQPANGTVISNWADKAGESLHPMIAVDSPTYTTNSQNGLPGITLAGNSGTTITSYFQAQVPPGTFLAELDAFVVYKNTGISSTVTFNTIITRNVLGANTGNPLDIVNANYTAGLANATNNTGSYNVFNTATSIFNINISQNTTASSKMTGYTNGSPITFTLSSGAATWTPSDIGNLLTLGSRGDRVTGFNGLFYEVMVFNHPLTPAGRQYVEGYLAWKWGLQTSLPTTHPYYQAAPDIQTLSFQPSQIYGLNLWLDGADPLNTGILPANAATIGTWFDKSPNAFSVASVGSPTYALATRSVTMNGTTQGFSFTYSGAHPTETGFVVVNMTTPNSFSFFINSIPSYSRQLYDYFTAITLGQTNIGGAGATTPSLITANSNTMLGYTLNPTNSFLYFNGTAGPTGTAFSVSPSESTIYIGYGGSGQYLAGTLSEVILFNTVLTTAERQVMEGYLAWKWGTQGSLPATHPYKTVQPSFLTFVPSYINTSNIAANAASYLPLISNTFDYGNAGQTVGSNGTLSFSNILGKNCLYINGSTTNYVSLPMSNANVFTVAFWFNYTNTNYFTVASYTTPAGAMAMQFDLVSAGSNVVYTALPNQWTNQPGSTNLGANTWNFIAVTVNQNTFVENVYMNGALASTATGTAVFPNSPNLMVLGKAGDGTVFPSGGTRSYQGYLQNFMYFDTILTSAHIAAIYEQTAQDLARASQPTSPSLTFSTPSLTFSWVAGTNTTSYVVTFYGVATNINYGGLFLATFTTTSTSQTYTPAAYAYYYATVTPTNSGFLGTPATSSAIQTLPSPATNVTMGAFAAQQTTISASWTAGAGATSYTVNFLSNAANSTSGGSVWQTITGVTGTSQASSTTLQSGSNGTYYYATVTSVNAAGSAAAATSSGTVRYYIPLWITGLRLWLDGADPLATGTPPSIGANVSFWFDKSGSAIHYRSAGTTTPTFSTDATYSRNGIFFPNTGNINNAYNQSNLTVSAFAPTTQFSILSVHRCINSVNIQAIWRNYNFTPNNDWVRWWPGNGWSMFLGGRLSNVSNSVNTPYNGINVAISDSSTVNLFTNGTNLISGTRSNATAQTATTSITIGGNGPNAPAECIYGYIFEVMIVNTNLSTTNRVILEGYLAWKWGIQSTLPAGHLYKSASP